MGVQLRKDIREEAELVRRFVESYRRKFASAIDQLNRSPHPGRELHAELSCLRLCVEAVDMMLDSHDRLARAMHEIAAGPAMMKAA
jgi:hypothetical protein